MRAIPALAMLVLSSACAGIPEAIPEGDVSFSERDGDATRDGASDDNQDALTSPAQLVTLTLSQGTLDPSFDPSVLHYRVVNLPFWIDVLDVVATPAQVDGLVSITPSSPVSIVSEGRVEILVQQDGVMRTYDVSFPSRQTRFVQASNGGTDDRFGTAVAIDGTTMVIGAPREDGDQDQLDGAGAAYVFTHDGANWQQTAILRAPQPGTGDAFGMTVAISGDTIVVGAPREDSDATGIDGAVNTNAADAGAAYVFSRGPSGAWLFEAYLKASNTDAGDRFAESLALRGDTLVVGATGEAAGFSSTPGDNSRPFAGAAYVYRRIAGAWTTQAYLKRGTIMANSYFGASVAVDGSTIAVGIPAEGTGGVRFFNEESDQWVMRGGIVGVGMGSQFGFSVALSGDRLIVGAPSEGTSGAVHAYVRALGVWNEVEFLGPSALSSSARFGGSVALDGTRLVVGADGDQSTGAAYLFTDDGTWTQRATLLASPAGFGDRFGFAVGISGNRALVGAMLDEAHAGSAYVFE